MTLHLQKGTATMSLESHYPSDCPFCRISEAYPASSGSPIPSAPDPTLVDPNAFVILSSDHILAFLDILPMTTGHVLLTTRVHHEKLSEVPIGPTAQALGYWMPLMSRALAKTLDIEDWNVVQNNGARASQVVPHVHFHFIPRYPDGRKPPSKKSKGDTFEVKSWKMFGRGQREELDEEEAVALAQHIREALKREVEALQNDTGKL
ncbi:zinc-binding protein of the histidine triad [Aureobasidium pullulans]|uniref:Zinc-binding protein of the histidine triad n=2 Tax=Aureobasidium pullulans TaxID=5580 RepID=A0A4S9VMH0_AURPU|nr:zinc-binding protein of the histidine triad [Aureobasidium pullulans]